MNYNNDFSTEIITGSAPLYDGLKSGALQTIPTPHDVPLFMR